MHAVAFVVACLACVGHGRRMQRPSPEDDWNTQQGLAALLLGVRPAAATAGLEESTHIRGPAGGVPSGAASAVARSQVDSHQRVRSPLAEQQQQKDERPPALQRSEFVRLRGGQDDGEAEEVAPAEDAEPEAAEDDAEEVAEALAEEEEEAAAEASAEEEEIAAPEAPAATEAEEEAPAEESAEEEEVAAASEAPPVMEVEEGAPAEESAEEEEAAASEVPPAMEAEAAPEASPEPVEEVAASEPVEEEEEETVEEVPVAAPAAPVEGEPVEDPGLQFVITAKMRAQLAQLGYAPAEIATLHPERAAAIIKRSIVRPDKGVPSSWQTMPKSHPGLKGLKFVKAISKIKKKALVPSVVLVTATGVVKAGLLSPIPGLLGGLLSALSAVGKKEATVEPPAPTLDLASAVNPDDYWLDQQIDKAIFFIKNKMR